MPLTQIFLHSPVVIPLLYVCLAWIYFPDLAISQGNSLAKKHRANFEEKLCGAKSSYWNRCYKFDLQHIANVNKISTELEKTTAIPESSLQLVGNLIVKSNNYLALYTKNGPVVISMPPEIYLQPVKNPCFGRDECGTEEQLLAFNN